MDRRPIGIIFDDIRSLPADTAMARLALDIISASVESEAYFFFILGAPRDEAALSIALSIHGCLAGRDWIRVPAAAAAPAETIWLDFSGGRNPHALRIKCARLVTSRDDLRNLNASTVVIAVGADVAPTKASFIIERFVGGVWATPYSAEINTPVKTQESLALAAGVVRDHSGIHGLEYLSSYPFETAPHLVACGVDAKPGDLSALARGFETLVRSRRQQGKLIVLGHPGSCAGSAGAFTEQQMLHQDIVFLANTSLIVRAAVMHTANLVIQVSADSETDATTVEDANFVGTPCALVASQGRRISSRPPPPTLLWTGGDDILTEKISQSLLNKFRIPASTWSSLSRRKAQNRAAIVADLFRMAGDGNT